ncbi:hypothetical protein CV019_00350, partial [Staphylococcus haemolyticus]
GAVQAAHNTGIGLVALAHVDHFLVVEQVEDREPGLQVDVVYRQRPGHAGTEVVGPRQAAARAAPGVLVDPPGDWTGAVLYAMPEGAATRTLGDEARGTQRIVGPGHTQLADRAARQRSERGTDTPDVVDRVGAAKFDLVATVIEQRAVVLV